MTENKIWYYRDEELLKEYFEGVYQQESAKMIDAICGAMLTFNSNGRHQLLTSKYSTEGKGILGDFLAETMSYLYDPKTCKKATSVLLTIRDPYRLICDALVELKKTQTAKFIRLTLIDVQGVEKEIAWEETFEVIESNIALHFQYYENTTPWVPPARKPRED